MYWAHFQPRLRVYCPVQSPHGSRRCHKLRAEGRSEEGAVFGRADFAAIARGFGVGGETVNDLSKLPDMITAFSKSSGAAVWDIPISDRVVSPVIRRAHPHRST